MRNVLFEEALTHERSFAEVAERHRIQAHLLGAEHEARSRDLRGLDAEKRAVRSLLLAELALYRRAGIFPRNPDFDSAMPYFIDASGTRCAMAHLMEIGGAGDLVVELATTRNNAFVAELAGDPRVVAWLDAAGLLPEEAARIQPSYCPSSAAGCVCGATGAKETTAIVRGKLVESDAGSGLHVLVEEMAGSASGPCAGLAVGDVVHYLGGSPGGESLTLTLGSFHENGGAASCAGFGAFATTAGAASCNNGLADSRLPADLRPAEVLAAITSNDCQGALAARSQAWTAPPEGACDGTSRSGCNAAGAPLEAFAFASTTMICAAIVAHRARRQLLARRAAARASRG